ncbi:hypothetical protein ACQ4FP_003128 [Escherichia coli]|nr:hypothetical protein [Escherichia coli]MBS6332439.1 hypothetical protein [Veillonella sp.]EFJ1930985.1 hypothetical protein [Escherichia coli]EKQ0789004.1 hypothetical protein [Escherichia coli]MBC0109626.1 hypothetical protein [Escherichia coli]
MATLNEKALSRKTLKEKNMILSETLKQTNAECEFLTIKLSIKEKECKELIEMNRSLLEKMERIESFYDSYVKLSKDFKAMQEDYKKSLREQIRLHEELKGYREKAVKEKKVQKMKNKGLRLVA